MPTSNLSNGLAASATPADWDSEHARNLRDFLTSETGQLALEWLMYFAPVLLDGSDVNKTLVANGEVKGYTGALGNLWSLTREKPQAPPQREEFPDLDDDTKWSEDQNKRPS